MNTTHTRRDAARKVAGLAALLLGLGHGPLLHAQSQDQSHTGHTGHEGHEGHEGHDMSEADPHAQHRAAMADDAVRQSLVDVAVAPTPLQRQDGSATTLAAEIGSHQPVLVAFIYTSCTTVCPLTSQIVSRTQELLGSDLQNMRLLSVSIDPEYDTPQRLQEYSRKFGARPQWQHYTGTLANSVAIQKAFGAYRGDKMNHVPLFFVRAAHSTRWLRLEGFPSAEQVTSALRGQA